MLRQQANLTSLCLVISPYKFFRLSRPRSQWMPPHPVGAGTDPRPTKTIACRLPPRLNRLNSSSGRPAMVLHPGCNLKSFFIVFAINDTYLKSCSASGAGGRRSQGVQERSRSPLLQASSTAESAATRLVPQGSEGFIAKAPGGAAIVHYCKPPATQNMESSGPCGSAAA
jgi:hypothetical protein